MSLWKKLYFVLLAVLCLIAVGLMSYLSMENDYTFGTLTEYLSYTDPQILGRKLFYKPDATAEELGAIEREQAAKLRSLLAPDCEVIFNLPDGSMKQMNTEQFVQLYIDSLHKDKRHHLWLDPTPREIKTIEGITYMYWRDAVIYADRVETMETRLTVTDEDGQMPQIIKLERTYKNTTETEKKEILDLLKIQTYQPTF